MLSAINYKVISDDRDYPSCPVPQHKGATEASKATQDWLESV